MGVRAGEREGSRGGGSPAFCHGTLDKTKTTHFSGPLPHLVFRNKSGHWLQGPDNTSSLPLSLGCCGGGGGVGWGVPSLQTDHAIRMQSLSCCKSTPPPPLPPSTAPATLPLFRRISQLFLAGRAKPSKDLHWRYVIKTRPPPHVAINIKIKDLYAEKMGSE